MQQHVSTSAPIQDTISICPAPPWVNRSRVVNAGRQADAPLTCLLQERRMHIPLKTDYFRYVHRLESPQAVQQLSKVQFRFDPQVDDLHIHNVSIFRNGNLTQHENLDSVELLRREENLGNNIMDGSICALLVLKDVRTGDVLDVEYSIVRRVDLFDGKACLIHDGQYAFPVARVLLSWTDEEDRPYFQKGELEGYLYAERSESGMLIREWTCSNTQALEPEDNVPADVIPEPFLQCCNFPSWDAIRDDLLKKWNFQPAERTSLDSEVRAIQDECGAEPEKLLDAVLMRVRDMVRYQARTPGLLAMVPENLSIVWERKYGDCKEKTLLFCWFMRELGFRCDPVLVHTQLCGRIEHMLPFAGAFNHVVARLSFEKSELWIDLTDIYRGGKPKEWCSMPYRVGLPLIEGNTGLLSIPYDKAELNELEVTETVHLDSKSRKGSIVMKLKAEGRRSEWLRALVDSEGLPGIMRFIKSLCEVGRKGFEFDEDPNWQDHRELNLMTIEVKGHVADMIKPDPEYARDFVNLTPFAFNGVLGFVPKTSRKLPFALWHPCGVSHEITVVHPSLNKADWPRKSAKDEHVIFDCGSRLAGSNPVYWFKYKTLTDRIEPKQLPLYKNKLESILKGLDIMLQLPSHGRRTIKSDDPEHVWGGGISSPTHERAWKKNESVNIVHFVWIALFVAFIIIRIFMAIL